MKGINSFDENGYWSCYSNDKWSVRKIYDDVLGYEYALSGKRFDALEIVDKLASLEAENAKLKALIERLVEAGQMLADELPYGANEEIVDTFDTLCDERQAMKSEALQDRDSDDIDDYALGSILDTNGTD